MGNGGRYFTNLTKSNLDTVAARVEVDAKGGSGANCVLICGNFGVVHGVVVDKDFGIIDIDLDYSIHLTAVLVTSGVKVKRELNL